MAGVAVQPTQFDAGTYERLDLSARPKQALDEARRARADFILINRVNIQDSGDAATRNFIGVLGIYAIKDGKPVDLVHLPRVEARFSHVKYIALQTAWAFFGEMRGNDLLRQSPMDDAVTSRIKSNLLKSYLRFLDLETEPNTKLQEQVSAALALPSVSDADVTTLLTSFVVPTSSTEHEDEERTRKQGFLAQLNR